MRREKTHRQPQIRLLVEEPNMVGPNFGRDYAPDGEPTASTRLGPRSHEDPEEQKREEPATVKKQYSLEHRADGSPDNEFIMFVALVGIYIAFNMQLMIPDEIGKARTENGTTGVFVSRSADVGDMALALMSIFLMFTSCTITTLPGYVSPRTLLVACSAMIAIFCGSRVFSSMIASLLAAAAGGIGIALLPAGCNLQMMDECETKKIADSMSARLPQGLAWICGSAIISLVTYFDQSLEEYKSTHSAAIQMVLFGIFAVLCLFTIGIFYLLPSSKGSVVRPSVKEQAAILWRRSHDLDILFLSPSFIYFGLHFVMGVSVFPKTINALRGTADDRAMIAYFAGAYGAGQGAMQGFLPNIPKGRRGLILTTLLHLAGYVLILFSCPLWASALDADEISKPTITQMATYAAVAGSFIFGAGDVTMNRKREYICKKIPETQRERNHSVFALAKIYQALGMAFLFAFSSYLSLPVWAIILAVVCIVSNLMYYKAHLILNDGREDDELVGGTVARDENTLPSFVYMF